MNTAVAQVVQEKVHDAPRAHLPPVDPSVVIPEAVRRAAERADNYYKKPEEPAPPAAPVAAAPAGETAPNTPAPAPAPAQVPAPAPAPVTDAGNQPDDQSWEHKFKSQQGRLAAQNTQIRDLQAQMNEIGQELVHSQRRIEQLTAQGNRPAAPQNLVTENERAEYGNEFIDVAQRAALEKINPQLAGVVQEVNTLKETLQRQATDGLYVVLTQAVPDWRAINHDPKFISWLGLRDPISGAIRRVLLDGAFRAADAARVVAIFKGFATAEAAQRPAETATTDPAPALPAPTRQPVVSLETLAAPGRARSAPTHVAAEKPIYTTAQISQFYNDVRRGVYAGRDADKNAIEQDIFAAQREARVRG